MKIEKIIIALLLIIVLSGIGTALSTSNLGYVRTSDLNVSGLAIFTNLTTFSGAVVGTGEMNIDLNWTKLQNYPTGCPVNTFVTTVGDSNTCTAINATVTNANNSDYLDSIDSTSLLRSDTDDTMTGKLTFSSSSGDEKLTLTDTGNKANASLDFTSSMIGKSSGGVYSYECTGSPSNNKCFFIGYTGTNGGVFGITGTGANSKWIATLTQDHTSATGGVAWLEQDGSADILALKHDGSGDHIVTGGTDENLRINPNGAGNVSIIGSLNVTGKYFGDGSSLTSVDATTLDSIDSLSLLRSDATDTATGALTFDNTITMYDDFTLWGNNATTKGQPRFDMKALGDNSTLIRTFGGASGATEIMAIVTDTTRIRFKSSQDTIDFETGGSNVRVRINGSDFGIGTGTGVIDARLEVNGPTDKPTILMTPESSMIACSSTFEGGMWYNTTSNKFLGCNSTDWVVLG